MATKLGKVSRMGADALKKTTIKPSYIDMNVPAGGASVGPPLGPILGEYGLPINKFVEDFNALTKDMKKGIPMQTRIHVEGKKYRIQLYEPCLKYLIRQAAGISKASEDGKVVGKITPRHVYEIASVKVEQEDYKIRNYSMRSMCELICSEAHALGVEVVDDLGDGESYEKFLMEKKEEEEELKRQQEQAMLEARKKIAKKLK